MNMIIQITTAIALDSQYYRTFWMLFPWRKK